MPPSMLSRRRFVQVSLGGGAAMLAPGFAAGAFGSGAGPVARRLAPADGLPRTIPEAQGVDSGAILAFLDEVATAGLEQNSFMLMRSGHVVAEGYWWPYLPQRKHMLHSLTKSITACGVGLALDEGRFGLDDKVASFFPAMVPPDASANLKAMTVRDLLTMRTGHAEETSGSVWRPIRTSWIAEFFKIPVPFEPGTNFVYTSAASYMLSAIVTRTTGRTMVDYLTPRMFEPMRMGPLDWDSSPDRVNPGGNGLSWTIADSAKLGALHARKGVWNGKRILSERWVREATRRHAGDEGNRGYGYHWWLFPDSDVYYAHGLFGQLSIVFPEHDAVLAMFNAINGIGKLRPIINRHFPAAFGAAIRASPSTTAVARRTAGLRLLPPAIPSSSPIARRISRRRFAIAPNDQNVRNVAFDFSPGRCTYRMADDRGSHRVENGMGEWLEGDTSMTGNRLHHEYQPDSIRVVAGARWLEVNTLEMVWQYVETSFRDTLTCHFDGDRVTIDRKVNINSAETKLPTLHGVAATR